MIDSGAAVSRAPRPDRARRVGRQCRARIPVVLGGCGTGRTSLLLRLRDLIGRTSCQYIDVERVATTPERFFASIREYVAAAVRRTPRPRPARSRRARGVRRDARVPRHGARARRRAGDVPARRVPRAADVRELSRAAHGAARFHRRAGDERQPLRPDDPLPRARAAAAARRAERSSRSSTSRR